MEINRGLGSVLPGVARLGKQKEYLAANEAYLSLIECRLDELIGSDWKSSIHPRDVPQAVHAFQDMESSGVGEFFGYMAAKKGDGVRSEEHTSELQSHVNLV